MNASLPTILNLSLPADSLKPIREPALAAFSQYGFPTRKLENWKYTDLHRLLAGQHFTAAATGGECAALPAGLPEGLKIIFVDGKLDTRHSDLADLPAGVTVESLNDASALALAALQQAQDYQQHPLLALNTALMSDGAIIRIERGTRLTQPLLLIYQCSADADGQVHNYRNIIMAEAESCVMLLEIAQACANTRHLLNTVTQIQAAEQAEVQHYAVQTEVTGQQHIAQIQVEQQRHSRVYSFNAALGAGLSRYDFHSKLIGEGAECLMDGVFVLRGKQHADSHTCVEHIASHTRSDQLYKGVVDQEAHGVFNGKAIAHSGSKGIRANQVNRNLLLSKAAAVDTKPELLIFTDDVQCSHGATVGQLDEQALFYMQSRGISVDEARGLLIQAFTMEVLTRIPVKTIETWLAGLVTAKMSQFNYLNRQA